MCIGTDIDLRRLAGPRAEHKVIASPVAVAAHTPQTGGESAQPGESAEPENSLLTPQCSISRSSSKHIAKVTAVFRTHSARTAAVFALMRLS